MDITPERRSVLLRIALMLIAVAALIASLTPTPVDDRIVQMLYQLLKERQDTLG